MHDLFRLRVVLEKCHLDLSFFRIEIRNRENIHKIFVGELLIEF